MRLPLIPPAELSPEQKALYDEMREGIASNFNASKVEREDGALMGPSNPWLHEPAKGICEAQASQEVGTCSLRAVATVSNFAKSRSNSDVVRP